jgi:hypothetical protein
LGRQKAKASCWKQLAATMSKDHDSAQAVVARCKKAVKELNPHMDELRSLALSTLKNSRAIDRIRNHVESGFRATISTIFNDTPLGCLYSRIVRAHLAEHV